MAAFFCVQEKTGLIFFPGRILNKPGKQ